jgi:adenylosuccinate lyase
MAIHPIEYRYGSREMKALFTEEARLQRLLDVEAALARAHFREGNIPREAAEAITEKASTDHVSLQRVKEIEGEIHHDLMAVVLALSEACGESGRFVHLGATSYDIIDTANALQFRAALDIVERDLRDLEGILLDLAGRHKTTVAIGRTHGQHALPITYGLKFAVWAREVRRHLERLEEGRKRILVGKMTGAVGTQASFGEKGPAIQRRVMEDLGLRSVEVSTQVVQRDRYAELLSLLALIAATLDKMGREIRNLSRTEIGEVSEPFREEKQVGSSTMPHKRNPIQSEKACGLSRVIRSHLFVALENVSLEHERDLTNSSSERVILPESFVLLDEILKTMKRVLQGLVFYPERIRKNLHLTGGAILAERVMMALVARGRDRQEAHELLRRLSLKAEGEGRPFSEVLAESPELEGVFQKGEIADLLDPETYTGTAVAQVEAILERAEKERALERRKRSGSRG